MILQSFSRFLRDEDGAAATEYAILAALVASVIAAAVTEFDLTGTYDAVTQAILALIK
ncbi:MAG: Flp family type IVb pilin [Rhodocyclaceae bacterium]|nr:Flp family type IVb pilin [Rhodocyclaceae bacterium]